MLTELPIIAAVLMISITAFLLVIFVLSKTKPATKEARVGLYDFLLLPSGKQLSGLLSLAEEVVAEHHALELARTKTIKSEQAKQLNDAFGDLFFYGLKSGGDKYLIASSQNLEDPEFAKVMSEEFVFPFGWIAKRMVTGDAGESEREGWHIVSIEPRSWKTNLTSETFEKMVAVGEAAACVKNLAIRIRKDLPYREIAEARGEQLDEAHKALAKSEHEKEEIKLGAAKKSLFGLEGGAPGAKPAQVVTEGFSFWRVLVSFISFLVTMALVPTYVPQLGEPLIPAGIIFFVVLFFVYPQAKKLFSRWF